MVVTCFDSQEVQDYPNTSCTALHLSFLLSTAWNDKLAEFESELLSDQPYVVR